jgi:hypothetical protein
VLGDLLAQLQSTNGGTIEARERRAMVVAPIDALEVIELF